MNFLKDVEGLKAKSLMREGTMFSLTYSCPVDMIRIDEPVRGPKNNKGHRSKTARITFKDSGQLLKGSLRELGLAFNCNTTKGDFPHKFASYENLDYIGP